MRTIGKTLIAAGIDVNSENDVGSTPLILVARNDRNDFTKMPLASGADSDAADNDGYTALHYATEVCFTEIIEQLLTVGANG